MSAKALWESRNETCSPALGLEPLVASRSQPERSTVLMFRVNYRSPETLPLHQRDFPPRRTEGIPSAEGSRELFILVAAYLVALFSGIVVLGTLATPTVPNTTTAEIMASR